MKIFVFAREKNAKLLIFHNVFAKIFRRPEQMREVNVIFAVLEKVNYFREIFSKN
jgi:hypothetical protein